MRRGYLARSTVQAVTGRPPTLRDRISPAGAGSGRYGCSSGGAATGHSMLTVAPLPASPCASLLPRWGCGLRHAGRLTAINRVGSRPLALLGESSAQRGLGWLGFGAGRPAYPCADFLAAHQALIFLRCAAF